MWYIWAREILFVSVSLFAIVQSADTESNPSFIQLRSNTRKMLAIVCLLLALVKTVGDFEQIYFGSPISGKA
jgi:hypothetical protein